MVGAQVVQAQTTLYLHADPNPKFKSLVQSSPGFTTPTTCRNGTANKILFRSADLTAGALAAPAALGFTLGAGIGGGAGSIGCQMQNSNEYLFWVTPPLTSDYTMTLNNLNPLSTVLGCQLGTNINVSLGFFLFKWDGAKDALTSSTEFLISTAGATCGITPINITPGYASATAVVMSFKRGDRIVIAPVTAKTGGGGATVTSVSVLVDAATGIGASKIVFPGTVPFSTVDDNTIGKRRVHTN